MIKLRKWQLVLIYMLCLPILDKICSALQKKAQETPEEWDDVLVGAFKVVIEFLKAPETFEET